MEKKITSKQTLGQLNFSPKSESFAACENQRLECKLCRIVNLNVSFLVSAYCSCPASSGTTHLYVTMKVVISCDYVREPPLF